MWFCQKAAAVWVVATCLVTLSSGAGEAATVPFVEEFESGPADWFDAAGGSAVAWRSMGGPDAGSFGETTFNFAASAADDSVVLFRAHDEFGSSGGAFVGNWRADGVMEFRAMVRHDASAPLSFFTRFASPRNFPGAIAVAFAPVPADTWTELIFPITPTNPQFVSFEGQDFETVFGDIGNVQIGVSVPSALAGQDQVFTFGIDKVAIVPEPATAGLLLMGLGWVWARRKGKNGMRS